MAGSAAIRAGAAYIEVFLEQNRLTRSMANVSNQLRTWSAGLSRMGGAAFGGSMPEPIAGLLRLAASPAGALTGMLGSAAKWASGGKAMSEMAAKAGTSVEAISALSYAARRSGVDTTQLATGIKKMQVTIANAAGGSAEAAADLAALGLSATELARMPAQEQMKVLADRISGVANPAQRAALAVAIFGRSGTDLLPLLLQGSAGIDRFTSRARDLGLIMSTESATGARELAMLIDDLRDVCSKAASTIGAALGPEIKGLTRWIIDTTVRTTQWIKEHKEVVVTALKITGAIVAAGVAFHALGMVFGLVGGLVGGVVSVIGMAASVIGTIGTVAAAAWTAIGGLSGIMAALASPVGLVAIGVIGLVAAVLWATGSIQELVGGIGQAFSGLLDDARKAFSGISDAIMAGDIALAGEILWTSLKLIWQKGVGWLMETWHGFQQSAADIFFDVLIKWVDFTSKLKSVWVDAVRWLSKIWEEWKVSTFEEGLANILAPIFAKQYGQSVEETRRNLAEDFARGRAALPGRQKEIDAEADAQLKAIERERGERRKMWGDARAAATQDIGARNAATRKELRDLQAQRDALVAKAGKERAEAAGVRKAELPKLADIGDIAAQAGSKVSLAGTFSASAVAGLGAGSGVDRIVKAVEKVVVKGDEQIQALNRAEKAFREGVQFA